MDARVAAATGHGGPGYTMLDLYRDYWLPFGKLLTDMEDAGMMVNRRAPPARRPMIGLWQGSLYLPNAARRPHCTLAHAGPAPPRLQQGAPPCAGRPCLCVHMYVAPPSPSPLSFNWVCAPG